MVSWPMRPIMRTLPPERCAAVAWLLPLPPTPIFSVRPTTVSPASAPGLDDFASRLDALDARLSDQESAIRHTLGMLIEWIESDGLRPIAA